MEISNFGVSRKLGAIMTSSMGVKEKNDFFDLTLRLELMLNGYSTEFKTEKSFQETDRLGVVCHHLGYDTYLRGFVRGAQIWVKFCPAPFCANSVLRHANGFGMPKIDVKLHSLPIPTLISHLFPKFEE